MKILERINFPDVGVSVIKAELTLKDVKAVEDMLKFIHGNPHEVEIHGENGIFWICIKRDITLPYKKLELR